MTTSYDACYQAQCAEDMAEATRQSVLALVVRLRDELTQTGRPIDVKTFVASHFPYDVQTGQLLLKAFDARLLRGRFSARSVHFDGNVSGVVDNLRPVWR